MNDGRTHWLGCYAEPGHHECALARVTDLEVLLKKTKSAAIAGMNAATAISYEQLRQAQRLASQSSPDALESERAMNAQLTRELERAEARTAELEQAMRDAPHEEFCKWVREFRRWQAGDQAVKWEAPCEHFCDCWKRHVLKVVEGEK